MVRQFVKVTIAALWPPTWPALGKRVVKNLGGLAKICVIALYLELLLSVPLVMLCITRGTEEEERGGEKERERSDVYVCTQYILQDQ